MNQLLPSYPDYKPAGLPWLAEVPAHWEQVSIRAITEVRNIRNRPDLQLLSVYREYGVIPKSSRDDNHNADGADLAAYKVVEPGYLVLNKMKTWQGSLGISSHHGIVSPAYIVCAVTRADIDKRYLNMLLRSRPYVAVYNSISFGVRVGQWDMRYDDFKQIKVLLPLLPEQQRIVAFLDGKTRQIARLLRNKRQLIKLLTEQKQALIHRALTQGLDADAPRKESGVAWLGEVPAHWELVPLKHLATKIQNGATPPSDETIYFENGTVPWYGPGSFKGQLELSAPVKSLSEKAFTDGKARRIKANSLMFIVIGATVGKSALLLNEGSCNQQVTAFELNLRVIDVEFAGLQAQLLEKHLRAQALNATIPILSSSILNNTLMAVPPLAEQKSIVESALNQAYLLDQTIARAQREIELIQEYRTRLIADVVTGRVDVRHLADAVSGLELPAEDELELEDEESEKEPVLETEDGRE